MQNSENLKAQLLNLGIDPRNISRISDELIDEMVKQEASYKDFADFFNKFVDDFLPPDVRSVKINPYEFDNEEEWLKVMVIKYLESKGIVFPKNSSETVYALSWYGKEIRKSGFYEFFTSLNSEDNSQGINMEEFKNIRRETLQFRYAEQTNKFTSKLTWATVALAVATAFLVVIAFFDLIFGNSSSLVP